MKKVNIGDIYQFLILIALIAFAVMGFMKNGEWNDMIVGAIIGVMASVPTKIIDKDDTKKEVVKDEISDR